MFRKYLHGEQWGKHTSTRSKAPSHDSLGGPISFRTILCSLVGGHVRPGLWQHMAAHRHGPNAPRFDSSNFGPRFCSSNFFWEGLVSWTGLVLVFRKYFVFCWYFCCVLLVFSSFDGLFLVFCCFFVWSFVRLLPVFFWSLSGLLLSNVFVFVCYCSGPFFWLFKTPLKSGMLLKDLIKIARGSKQKMRVWTCLFPSFLQNSNS